MSEQKGLYDLDDFVGMKMKMMMVMRFRMITRTIRSDNKAGEKKGMIKI